MLDEHHPTWVAKRSNNVRSSKVGGLNPTLFDSLATALASLKSIHQITLINNNFKKTQIGSTARPAIKFALILSYFGDCKFALDRVQLLNRIRCRETNALRIIDRNNFN